VVRSNQVIGRRGKGLRVKSRKEKVSSKGGMNGKHLGKADTQESIDYRELLSKRMM
jgi:hypothetical protein